MEPLEPPLDPPLVYKRRARDANNRMFLHVLNVNLDHYDFPSDFVERLRFVIGINDSALSRRRQTGQHNYPGCKNSSCQSPTRVAAF